MDTMPDHDWYGDTDPKALEVFLDLQRKMTAEEKLRAVFQLNDFLMRLVEAGVRSQHPQADDREVFLRCAARRLDRETMIRVYGWDPELARP
jgi:hypothetical protein